MGERSESASKNPGRSPLMEWIFGGIGLALTLSMIGFIAWQAVTRPPEEPARIELRVDKVTRSGRGYVVEIVARNASPTTAKGVEVVGTLSTGSAARETSGVTFDYIPGGSTVHGALRFSRDPATGDLRLRTLGYTDP